MLRALHVQNFVLIDDLTIDFGRGFCAFTGETGAGKSLLVDALTLLSGGRAQRDAIRHGAKEAVVEATFSLADAPKARAILEELGIAAEDDEIVLRRVVGAEGKNKVVVGGQLSSVSELGRIAAALVQLCGQNAHTEIANPDAALATLDRHAGLGRQRDEFAEAYRAHEALARERATLVEGEAQRLQRLDYLRFQLEELSEASPEVGEESRLKGERNRLAHAEKLLLGLGHASSAIGGEDGGALERLGVARRPLRELVKLDPSLEPLVTRVDAAHAELDDLARELERYLDALEADPESLNTLEARLALLARLAKKHGVAADALPERKDQLAAEAQALAASDDRRATLDREVDAAAARALGLGEKLSAARAKAAKAFGRAVSESLRPLAMPKADFRATMVSCGSLADASAQGLDRCILEMAANPGEPRRPVAKVASGGELSRVSLALQAVLGDSSEVPTYVFDEVDAGIGGAVAEVVGRTLAGLGERRQVLSVTHLAQIAALADRQLKVTKVIEGGRTVSSVAELDPSSRRDELARMLGGVEITDAVRKHAAELLERRELKKAV